MDHLPGLAYGADYNPDQWPEDVWKQDAELMVEAGVNLVTLPVFGWAAIEPAPGRYNFGWLDRVIDMLWSRGIRLDLSTATATPPAWLVRAQPEVLPVTASGVRLEFGSRQSYCPSSPVLREHVVRLCRSMAERYGRHPALAMWHVSNEYGDELSRCWCEQSADHFRRWLRDRYGSLEALNQAWGTTCWGQHYGGWEHIAPPRDTTGPANPAHLLDFERFSSDALLDLYAAEVEVLREVTPDVPVTTNFMGTFRQLDYWRFAELEDVVSNDAYPDPADPGSFRASALGCSLMRSLKGGRPWLLMEQAPSAVSWRAVNVPQPPGLMRLHSMQAVAHGADGVLFFQWRAARVGAERFHSAMVGHRGAVGRTWSECRDLGSELGRLAEVRGSRVDARVALVMDWDSWWALDPAASLPTERLDWIKQLRSYHAALFELGVVADLVAAQGDLAGYDAVIAPNLFLLDSVAGARFAEYVHGGGRLLVGPFSGVVDASARVHLGGAPGPLRDLLGVAVDEPWPLADGDSVRVGFDEIEMQARHWAEALVCDGAETVGTYREGPLDGGPAVTRNAAGAGAAYYLSTLLDPDGLRAVLTHVLADAGVPVANHPGVEVVTRRAEHAAYTFVLNHAPVEVTHVLAEAGRELLTGVDLGGTMTLPPFGVAVVRTHIEGER
jgi:beta-galactosidase